MLTFQIVLFVITYMLVFHTFELGFTWPSVLPSSLVTLKYKTLLEVTCLSFLIELSKESSVMHLGMAISW